MQTLAQIRASLDARGLAPRKSFGQNFLIDHNLIRKLADRSGVRNGDTVLEVGPGTGALTGELLERGVRVVACEIDRGLCELLRETLGVEHPDHFTLVEGDALGKGRTLSPASEDALGGAPFSLVANLPYNIATPLIVFLLTSVPRCGSMHVTIQKEVAERFSASPGTRAYGAISIVAQSLASIDPLVTLPPECFWPRPEVTSAMISLTRLDDIEEMDRWPDRARTLQALFSARRKSLGRALRGLGLRGVGLPEGVTESDRLETLGPGTVVELLRRMEAAGED